MTNKERELSEALRKLINVALSVAENGRHQCMDGKRCSPCERLEKAAKKALATLAGPVSP